jgi:hypothetical protein
MTKTIEGIISTLDIPTKNRNRGSFFQIVRLLVYNGKNDANVPIIPADITLPNQYEKRSTLAPPRHPKATVNFFICIFFMM